MSSFEKFLDEMRKMDCAPADPSEIVDDDKIHRYQLEGDKRGVKNASYCLRTEPDGFAFGWFQSFKQGEVHKWHSKSSRKATDEERAAWKAKLEAARKRRDEEEKKRHDEAAAVGKKLWSEASTEGSNSYLDRKGIGLNGARMHDGRVVIPVYNPGIVGTQTIDDSVGASDRQRGVVGVRWDWYGRRTLPRSAPILWRGYRRILGS